MDAFDGRRSRLYTYSEEMHERYAQHHPIRELAVHLDLHKMEHAARDGNGLVWLGRIDKEKSPHLAIRAAQLLGREITVAGPVFDPAYAETHRALFAAEQVTLTGEVGGPARARLLAEADVLVYTCARDYIEAGAATFGEALRAGTPVAALAWRPGTCAHAALCAGTGSVALVEPAGDDDLAAGALADAIERASPLRAGDVEEIGKDRFGPARHFRVLSTRPC